eukprot:UN00371
MITNTALTVTAKGLPPQWTEESIKSVFSQFGPLTAVNFPAGAAKRKTPPTKITAFITFENEEGKQAALATATFDFTDPSNNVTGQFSVHPYIEQKAKAKAPRGAKGKAPAPKVRRTKPLNQETTVVAKVPKTWPAKQIKETFAHFGTVAKLIITRPRNRFAPQTKTTFVTFADKASADSLLTTSEFDVQEGEVTTRITVDKYEVREPKQRPQPKAVAGKKAAPKKPAQKKKNIEVPNTVVVKGVVVAMTADEVKAVLSKFGTVNSVRFARPGQTYKLAFAAFADEAAKNAALAAKDIENFNILEYSTTPPFNKRVVFAHIPLAYDEAKIKAIAEQYGAFADIPTAFKVFSAQKPAEEGKEVKAREYQTAIVLYAQEEAAQKAVAAKTIKEGEDEIAVRSYRYRRNNNKRVPRN